MKNTLILICLLGAFMNSSINAQSIMDKLGAGINVDVKAPQGALKNNGLTEYYGLSLEAFYVGCADKKIRLMPGYRINGGITESIIGSQVTVAQPVGAQATEKLFNAFFGIEFVGRAMYDNGHIFRPYAEVYAGPRMTGGYETLALNNEIEGYTNSTELVFSNASISAGAGLGALVQISDAIDLNFKMTTEYTGQIGHSDFDQPDNYTTQKIESSNVFNHSFTVGVFFRPKCGRRNNDSARKKNRRSPRNPYRDYYRYETNTKPIKVRRADRG